MVGWNLRLDGYPVDALPTASVSSCLFGRTVPRPMALNKAILAAFKAATRLSPDVKSSYKAQRVAEDLSGALSLRNPRCRVEEMSATAPDGYEIPLLVFTPRDIDFSLREGLQVSDESKGTILFFHGGGWVNGDTAFYADACATTALQLERRVVSVDYRRAPEHRFPQAPQDCYEVARQLFAGTLLPDVNPHDIVLFGDSAGGNLAAVVSLMARDRGEFMPRRQMLLYPATYNDHSSTSRFESVRTNGEDYLLTSQDVVDYMDLYISGPQDLQNPYFAPLLAPRLDDQPQTLVITAEYCPLRDEGETYAMRLEQEGNDVACYRMFDAVHGYFLYPSVLSLVKDTYRIMRNFLDGEELEQEAKPAWLKISGIA